MGILNSVKNAVDKAAIFVYDVCHAVSEDTPAESVDEASHVLVSPSGNKNSTKREMYRTLYLVADKELCKADLSVIAENLLYDNVTDALQEYKCADLNGMMLLEFQLDLSTEFDYTNSADVRLFKNFVMVNLRNEQTDMHVTEQYFIEQFMEMSGSRDTGKHKDYKYVRNVTTSEKPMLCGGDIPDWVNTRYKIFDISCVLEVNQYSITHGKDDAYYITGKQFDQEW